MAPEFLRNIEISIGTLEDPSNSMNSSWPQRVFVATVRIVVEITLFYEDCYE